MPKVKSPRTTKPKAENSEKKILQMRETSGNGNGKVPASDLESEIRARAYELYEQRGYTNGCSEEDWFQAEREVLARHGHAHTA